MKCQENKLLHIPNIIISTILEMTSKLANLALLFVPQTIPNPSS